MFTKQLNVTEFFLFCSREVFKARDKSNPNKYVAMKKVLMENEKEGVSKCTMNMPKLQNIKLSSPVPVSNHSFKRNSNITTSEA